MPGLDSTKTSLLAAVLLAVLNTAAVGQILPHGYGYSGWGAYPYGGFNSSYNTSRALDEEAQIATEQHAWQQSAQLQSSIRNTLSSQARTNAQGILGEQQRAEDWWFQQEQRKLAESRQATREADELRASGFVDPNAVDPVTAAARRGEALAPPAAATPHSPATASQPSPAHKVTPWPPLLQDARFAASREKLETVFRQWQSPDRPLPPDQYRVILVGISEMKTTLRDIAPDISAADYLNTEKYLDGLVYDACAAVAKTAPPEK